MILGAITQTNLHKTQLFVLLFQNVGIVAKRPNSLITILILRGNTMYIIIENLVKGDINRETAQK